MTQDNGMDLSPSWQELKAEHDALMAHVAAEKAVVADVMKVAIQHPAER